MYTASCLCGACRLEVGSIIGTGICHCTNCKKLTSSVYSVNAVVPTSDFRLSAGTPKQKIIVGGVTQTKTTTNFCGDCGGTLWMDYPPRPEWKIVKSGVFDEVDVMEIEVLHPKVEQFVERRPSWLCAIEGAVQESGQPELTKANVMIEDMKAGKHPSESDV